MDGRAGVSVDWTEDVTRLSNLNQYKAVIFASMSRDKLFKHGTAVSATAAVNTLLHVQRVIAFA